MQEIHSIGTGGGGGGSRFFGGGDRRLRPQQNNHQNNQALKCPRCDSLNTKFCYYNNYNLSQPRHFCKNCRRYWTKGGVLRNVPVGGGCRKSKRSSKPKNSSSSEISAQPTTAPTPETNHKSNSHTSSDSSSLTATAATEALSAPTPLNADSNNNKNYNEESQLLIHANPSKTVMEANALEQGAGDCGIFSEIATFTSLITSSNEPLAFGFGTSNGIPEASSFQWQNQKVMTVTGDQPCHRNEEEMKLPESVGNGAVGSLLDQTVDFSVLHSKNRNGGFGSLDWHGDGSADHQGLFDLPNTVDQSYWTNTHWSDPDNSNLFHLP